ncbi:hypothetical protein M422DRAFT_264821 [Sphaerobolus stellatus SS14]|uniref:DDE-1 domain-containing protein n=1 Tax=Sphaerobolus stellatus (strain SS14) TaxID=990650 RepID=A0A0C9UVH7_SPHS4|nr:hypothetical protein M422DRAFT_264821 [Sphaerobolus stellatus SS14]
MPRCLSSQFDKRQGEQPIDDNGSEGPIVISDSEEPIVISDSEDDVCSWSGGVICAPDIHGTDDGYITVWDTEEEIESVGEQGDDDIFEVLQGEEVIDGLQKSCKMQQDLEELSTPTSYERIMGVKGLKQWRKAESNRALGYNGLSGHRKREIQQENHEKEAAAAKMRETKMAKNFHSFFTQAPIPPPPDPNSAPEASNSHLANEAATPLIPVESTEVFQGYLSDISDDEWMGDDEEGGGDDDEEEDEDTAPQAPTEGKRRKLNFPVCEMWAKNREARKLKQKRALEDIEQLIASKLDVFAAGTEKQHSFIDASKRAAESHKLSENWGGRMVCSWVTCWINTRELPSSKRGCHSKVYSLLDDPEICTELRSYLHSNKWAIDPKKLALFSKQKLIPDEASKYLHQIVNTEMPTGLKKYMELELFPHIQMKVAKGVSLSTARSWLKKEGFRYTAHKKALYYDGHERPDVVQYRQDVFVPEMRSYGQRLVKYDVGDVKEEVPLHLSIFLMETNWLTLEYGKNYDGYWNGELFVKQLKEWFFPAFEKAHGPGYQALVMVDNSQGHSAYAENALLTTRMNLRPGGEQARLRHGWFIRDGYKIIQPMIFPSNHPEFPDKPKGMQQVLSERGLYRPGLKMQCKKKKDGSGGKCLPESIDCCAKCILDLQPDFKEQKSLVQEVIEEAGHLCIFLPKFHCELNFIEYFWGAVERYLRIHSDGSFSTLQENMGKALASVPLETIRKWEHRMKHWLEAYGNGLDGKEAEKQGRKFSSRQYTSHRRISEASTY